jgi:hypothetical protein
MGVLSELILLAAALPAIEESVTMLQPSFIAGPLLDRFTVISIPPPRRAPEHSHFRIRLGSAVVWVDGARLTPNEDGDFDLLNLDWRRPSRLTAPGWLPAATMIETPRVFVSRHEIAASGGVWLWVRNSLENTVNVYARLTGSAGQEIAGSATIPPGVTQAVSLEGAAPLGPPWRLYLEKQEEAMEGGYTFTKTLVGTSSTVNTYGKP